MGKIYLQMYSFTDGIHNDVIENLRLASEMGYDGVELFGPNLEIPAPEMKGLLEKYGLEPISLHAPSPQTLIETIPYAAAVGCKFIGISSESMLDDAAVHDWASRMNILGKAAKESGVIYVYHNHTQEFLPCEGKRVIDVLMEETDPEYVSFELDAGWCAAAGEDPVQLVQQYSGRFRLLHVKESSRVIGPQPPFDFSLVTIDENGNWHLPKEIQETLDRNRKINCHACEGLVDWKTMIETADANGCCGHIVEREYSEGDRIEELTNDIRRYREVM